MTGKELFEKYGGRCVRPIKNSTSWDTDEEYRICGYNLKEVDRVVIEHKHGASLSAFLKDTKTFVVMPGLPEKWHGFNTHITTFDWDNVTKFKPKTNLCCRCGKMYASRQEHRISCGKKR